MLPEDRAGYILKDVDGIINVMKDALNDADSFIESYKTVRERILRKIFTNPDGKATERVINEILKFSENEVDHFDAIKDTVLNLHIIKKVLRGVFPQLIGKQEEMQIGIKIQPIL